MRSMIPVLLAAALALLVSTPATAQKKDADIKFRLAQSYERSGDYESALKLYRELYRGDSLNVVVIEALKRDLLQLKRYPEAIAQYKEALRIDPQHRGAHEYLGMAYVQTKDIGKAKELLASLETICGVTCEEYLALQKAIAKADKK